MGLLLRLIDRWDAEQIRRDRRSGEIAATMANTTRAKSTDRVWSWVDFYPEHKPPPREQTDDEMLMSMKIWAAVANRRAALA